MNSSKIKLQEESRMLEPLNVESLEFKEKDELSDYKYDRPIEYWLIIIGYAIGYGSFWRFPYLVYSCGGGVFFIPFLIFFFAIGIPIFTLEAALGQMFKKGPVEVFEMVKKKFSGIGWASVIVSWILSLYYAIILCWSVFYFFQSFKNPLPWSKEASLLSKNQSSILSNLTNSSLYQNLTLNLNTTEDTSEEDYINLDYFVKRVLKQSEGIHNMGSIDGELCLCLILTYILIFVCIFKGVKSSSKVVYFTAPTPIILLIILLFKVLTLPGISIGLKYLFLPNLSKLFDIDVWIKACNQVMFMLSLGMGCNILFSSFRKESEDVYQSSYWIPVMTICFGLMCAIINFSYLGHFSYIVGIPLESLPLSGTDLAFISYPNALCMLPWPNMWSILFFFMLITLGIDTQFAFNDIVSHYVYDNYLYKHVTRTQCSLIICFSGFVLGLPFIMNGGFYLFELVDSYATLISCFSICVLEAFIVTKYIGLDTLKEIVMNKTGKTIPEYVYTSIRYTAPIANIVLILFCVNKALAEKIKYEANWPYFIQWIVILAPLAAILYPFIIYYKEESPNKDSHQLKEMNEMFPADDSRFSKT